LTVTLPITRAAEGSHIQVTYQGCAAARFCYPPETRTIPLHTITPKDPQLPLQRSPNTNELPFSPFWALLISIAIAFTPCVFPMYPLIAAIILGSETPRSPRKIFWLVLTYVQGMALTYTLLGWVVARAGLQFQTALQHPYVLFTLSAVFILLALSMFGFYSINFPSHWQTRLAAWSNHLKKWFSGRRFYYGSISGSDLFSLYYSAPQRHLAVHCTERQYTRRGSYPIPVCIRNGDPFNYSDPLRQPNITP